MQFVFINDRKVSSAFGLGNGLSFGLTEKQKGITVIKLEQEDLNPKIDFRIQIFSGLFIFRWGKPYFRPLEFDWTRSNGENDTLIGPPGCPTFKTSSFSNPNTNRRIASIHPLFWSGACNLFFGPGLRYPRRFPTYPPAGGEEISFPLSGPSGPPGAR